MIGADGAARGDHAGDAAVLDHKVCRRQIGEAGQFAGLFGGLDQFAGDGLRAGDDEAGVRVPHGALDHGFFQQRKLFLGLGGRDHRDAGAERLAGGDLALEFGHALVVAGARHFETADPRIAAHLLVEIDRIERRPAGQMVVAGRVAEVRGVRGGADIGGDRRLVDADNVPPAALDQVMGDRGADNAADTDDDDIRMFGKSCHGSASARQS